MWQAASQANVEVIRHESESGKNEELIFLASHIHDWFNQYTGDITKVCHLTAVAKMFELDVSKQRDLTCHLAETGFSMGAYMEPEKLRKNNG